MIWASLGEGSLAVIMGKFMDWFSYNWLIYGMTIMDLVIILLMRGNRMIIRSSRDKIDKENSSYLLDKDRGKMGEFGQMIELQEMRKTSV